MRMVEEGTPNPGGEALVEELAWVHGIIRSNLATITDIVEGIRGGSPAEEVQAQVKEMADTSAVWTLRINCQR